MGVSSAALLCNDRYVSVESLGPAHKLLLAEPIIVKRCYACGISLKSCKQGGPNRLLVKQADGELAHECTGS